MRDLSHGTTKSIYQDTINRDVNSVEKQVGRPKVLLQEPSGIAEILFAILFAQVSFPNRTISEHRPEIIKESLFEKMDELGPVRPRFA